MANDRQIISGSINYLDSSVHHIKLLYLFTRIGLNPSIHMKSFYDTLMSFLYYLYFGYLDFQLGGYLKIS